jgi:hypothetical protein
LSDDRLGRAWRIIWLKIWSYPSLAAVRSVGSQTYRCLWTITTKPLSPAQSADMKLHGRSSFRSRLRNECHPRAASHRHGRSRKAPPASSCATTTSKRWPMSIRPSDACRKRSARLILSQSTLATFSAGCDFGAAHQEKRRTYAQQERNRCGGIVPLFKTVWRNSHESAKPEPKPARSARRPRRAAR